MSGIAIEVGSTLCGSAVQLGLHGLRCYEEAFQQSLGWTAGALMVLAVTAISKGLRWR